MSNELVSVRMQSQCHMHPGEIAEAVALASFADTAFIICSLRRAIGIETGAPLGLAERITMQEGKRFSRARGEHVFLK
jgi:hypothetical protein